MMKTIINLEDAQLLLFAFSKETDLRENNIVIFFFITLSNKITFRLYNDTVSRGQELSVVPVAI